MLAEPMTAENRGLDKGRASVDCQDEEFMRQAIKLARIALEQGDTPVGSIVVCNGHIIAEGVEAVRRENDLTAHAELRAIEKACQAFGSRNLGNCMLYTTVEPCWMCSFVIRSASVSRVVIGRTVPGIGGFSSKYPLLTDPDIPNWPPPPAVVTGVLEEECAGLFAR